MKYENTVKGIFIERPNRFIAKVEIDGKIETVHVKNTGRCKELLIKGSTVYLSKSNNPNRKTAYDLVCVEKGERLINIDSQIPNDVVNEWIKGGLFSNNAIIKREKTYNNSRFDFYIEDLGRKIFLEVKGVTLEKNSVAFFPDAPTLRGIKHIKELEETVAKGYDAYILFVIQMEKIKFFSPNDQTHKAFGDALRQAVKNGVKILAYTCEVSCDSIKIKSPVPIKLD
ncbi:MAG: DNA/RNA nuclease SfsA [Clostridia bacterium]|nr:DNA/RNA nuclease SfsA [Clostridia bacterium]